MASRRSVRDSRVTTWGRFTASFLRRLRSIAFMWMLVLLAAASSCRTTLHEAPGAPEDSAPRTRVDEPAAPADADPGEKTTEGSSETVAQTASTEEGQTAGRDRGSTADTQPPDRAGEVISDSEESAPGADTWGQAAGVRGPAVSQLMVVPPVRGEGQDAAIKPWGEPRPEARTGGAAPVPAPAGAGQQPHEGRESPRFVLSLVATPPNPRVGEGLTVEILASASVKVVDAPFHLAYDPEKLKFRDASSGEFLSQDGSSLVFLVNGGTRPGDVAIGIGRTNRRSGIGGTGRLCSVRFVSLAPGATSIRIEQGMAREDNGALLQVSATPVIIAIF